MKICSPQPALQNIQGSFSQLPSCAGASKHDDGMEISVTWDDDGFTSGISNELLKAKVHCRLKLIEFYESKIKAVSRKKRNK